MVQPEDANEIVKRALAYPYAVPASSFVLFEGRALELPDAGPDLTSRVPLLAYGANAAPTALARKLAVLPPSPLPVLRAELDGYDVVYSAHVSFHGAVPANLHPSAGTTTPVFVAFPNEEQLAALSATEPNYELAALHSPHLRLESGEEVGEAAAYLSRHGSLSLGGAPVALTAVASAARRFPTMTEPEVLELVRTQLAPDLSLEAFVLRCVESDGVAPLPELAPSED